MRKLEELTTYLTMNIYSNELEKLMQSLQFQERRSEVSEGNRHEDYYFDGVTLFFIHQLLMKIEIKKRALFSALPATKDEVMQLFGEEKEHFFKRDKKLFYEMKKYKILFSLANDKYVENIVLMAK